MIAPAFRSRWRELLPRSGAAWVGIALACVGPLVAAAAGAPAAGRRAARVNRRWPGSILDPSG